MNPEKARELFSEHREGTLSENLRASFESALSANSTLAGEYSQFCELLDGLEASKSSVVEVPFDLHDKIMARVDKSVFEERRKAKTGWLSGWRLALISGAAVITVIGTIASFNNQGTGASLSGAMNIDESRGLSLAIKDGSLYVRHGSSAGASVLVKDESNGNLVKRFDLGGKSLDSQLSNDGDSAVLLRVESNAGQNSTVFLVAVPGKKTHVTLEGTGTVRELAKAVADTYREPVQISTNELVGSVTWKLDTSDPTHSKATEGTFTLERRNGLLYLAD